MHQSMLQTVNYPNETTNESNIIWVTSDAMAVKGSRLNNSVNE